MKNKLKKQNGITLIVLVITVIVLLILAGVTINLTIGQDGILKRAEEAGMNYTEAAEKEKTELVQFSNLTDKIIDNVTKNHYTMVDGVPVPKGFSHTEGTKDTGFVIKNDTDGNEFVWVPCTIDGANESIKYDRYEFLTTQLADGIDIETDSMKIKHSSDKDYIYTERMQSDEQTSVRLYGGFYIGRYETGIEGKAERTSDSGILDSIVVKRGKNVYNYISYKEAKVKAENLYTKPNNGVKSKLCSSYAWDTALKFIETTNTAYATSGFGGNYKDKTFSYMDLNGEVQNKDENSVIMVPTGQTTPVNNIYDMGGNVWEWTTEECKCENLQFGTRGGARDNNSKYDPAGKRGHANKDASQNNISFRITLYL